ncbi:MAG: choice-of-anchor D domain-containing protein [Acidobacteriia bacterium]|nr:choice-of-anchor D domain-containing protein [Terriglobia bacterium]
MIRFRLTSTVFLLGFGLLSYANAQQLQISPSSLSFKNQLINTTSDSQTVTLTNSGSSSVTVSSIVPSGMYNETTDCAVLNAGESCTIDVTFSPVVIGKTDGAVTITSSAQPGPQSVGLAGTALAPVKLSPLGLNFGLVAVGTSSQPKLVKLTNQQATAVSITAIATSGDYGQSNNCPGSLGAGQSCSIHVVFQPTAGTFIPGALSVSTNSTGPAPVLLEGTGTTGPTSIVSLSTTSLDFGDETVGLFTDTQRVTLTNTSQTTSLNIQSVTVSGFGWYDLQFARPPCSGMLAPGAQCVIVVFFNPLANLMPAPYPGAVTIVDDDVTSPQVIGLSGNGQNELVFRPAVLHFAPQKVGTTSPPQIVTVDSTLQNDVGIFLDTFSTGDYSFTGFGTHACNLGETIPSSCTIAVTFTPSRKGVVNGAVTYDNYPLCGFGSCSTPSVLSMTGTGQ